MRSPKSFSDDSDGEEDWEVVASGRMEEQIVVEPQQQLDNYNVDAPSDTTQRNHESVDNPVHGNLDSSTKPTTAENLVEASNIHKNVQDEKQPLLQQKIAGESHQELATTEKSNKSDQNEKGDVDTNTNTSIVQQAVGGQEEGEEQQPQPSRSPRGRRIHAFNKSLSKSFRQATSKIQSTVKNVDEKLHIHEKSKSVFENVGKSARNAGCTIRQETKRIGDKIKQSDLKGKSQNAAKSASRKAKQFNDKYNVTETVTVAAVVSSATFLAKGDKKAGASAMAIAGASFLAGEAMKAPAHDDGLNERMHME
mmetsp:Transcript_12154/g.16006  ORF Transcript_12154/g.16006 Transcript_12154/m.16006 type:complete len:309 (+) Transcript_12154:106-1032(+)